MLRFILLPIIFLCHASIFANSTNNDTRYTHIKFFIQNKTTYPVLLKLSNVEGVFEAPFLIGSSILLNPNDHYENILIGAKKENDIETFLSAAVYEIGNERENYLIFSETGDLHVKFLSADIFDGLGKLFVRSNTNGCHAVTPEGYAYCTLEIRA